MQMLVIVAGIVIFIYGMLASMLGTIVPGLGAQLHLTTLQMSWLALAQGLGLAVTSVWAGAFMDRRGKKPGVVFGLVASIVGLALLAWPLNLPLALLAMICLGVGGSLVIVGANSLVNDVSESNKASALNILNLFVGLGGMATPLVAGNLLHSDATKTAWFGIGIAAIALILTFMTPIPKPSPRRARLGSMSIFSQGALYVLASVTFLYTACEFAMWNWLPKLLIARNVPAVTALNILSLGFACGILVGRFLAARLTSRASPTAVVSSCAGAMCVLTLAILHARGVPAYAVLVFATGLAMAPVFPTTIAIVGRLFPQASGTAIGFAITCGFSGLVVSSPMIGLLAGPRPDGIGRALLMVPVLSGLIVSILVGFRKTLNTPEQ